MPHLGMAFLGGFRVTLDGAPLTTFESNKVRALLAYLATEAHRPHPRESLAALLWPDWPDRAALTNLRSTLSDLRKVIGDRQSDPPFLLINREAIQFNVESDHNLDVAVFTHLVVGEEAERLEQAVSLYEGEFLEGFSVSDAAPFEDWARLKREQLHRAFLDTLHRIASTLERCGEARRALSFARRQVEVEPWDEKAHRQVMRLLALNGRRSEALIQYEACRGVLEKELHTKPSSETEDLYQLLLEGELRTEASGEPAKLYEQIQTGQADFPAFKTLDTRRQNLPLQLTSFIGREQEMADIRAILEKTAPARRLLTLTGSGGTGKTRLALQTGAELIDNFPDGVWFVDLAPLTNTELVPHAMASVWQLREQPCHPLSEVLCEYLRTKELLVILDNCEHLVEACAKLCQAILQACAGVKILATSREPLRVPGELLYRIPGLSLPDARISPTLEALSHSEAVRLFIDRAITARPDFSVNPANESAIVQICQRLDGIPLAIELAAARLRAFSTEQVAVRLEDRFRVLTYGSRTSLPRHQTLGALIDWSYNLLTEEERLLFQRLAVFSGGWSLEAAEMICSGEGIDPYNIFDLMARLVDRSLVIAEEQAEQPRYSLLETLRQYAEQVLQKSGQQAYWHGRHLEYYLNMAEEVEPQLRSAKDILGIEQLTRENDNLRAAFETAVQEENTKDVLRLSGALHYFWQRSGRFQEGMNRMLQAIRMPNTEQRPLEFANVLQCLGMFYWLNGIYQTALETLNRSIDLVHTMGAPARYVLASALSWRGVTFMRLVDFVSAQRDSEAARELFQEINDAYGLAFANYTLGRISIEQGDFQTAWPYLEQALKWSRTAGDRWVTALVINSLELLVISNGDYSTAQALNQESLDLAQQMNDVWMIAGGLREAGNLAQIIGDYHAASGYFSECGEISRQQGLLNDYARSRFNLGYVAILKGDLNSGRAYLRESRDIFSQLDYWRGQVDCIDSFAALAASSGHLELAACLLGASDAVFQLMSAKRWPVDQHEYDKLRVRLMEDLGVETFTSQYTSGHKLSLKQALETAVGV